jgi:hypothetical protein
MFKHSAKVEKVFDMFKHLNINFFKIIFLFIFERR